MLIMSGRFLQHVLHVFVVLPFLYMSMNPALGLFTTSGVGVGVGVGVGGKMIRCVERERQDLLTFKRGLIDHYGRLSSWGSEEDKKDCCKWKGVHCSNLTHHVVKLDLRAPRSKPLTGMLGPSLLELRHLNYLDLSNNDFGGNPIPKFIDSLVNLRYLNLSNAKFGGEIPHQLGNLSNLQSLDISGYFYNDVKGLDWLSHLHSLRDLDLSFVDLGEVVDWLQIINNLPLLTTLQLRGCWLPKIIPTFLPSVNRSTSLVILDLSENFLNSSIFHWLFNSSSSLVHINLADGEIEGAIPGAFGNMIALSHLDLSKNQLEGGIPKSFGNLSQLQMLNLASNSLNETLAKCFQNLHGVAENISSLRELNLGENVIKSSFPKSVGQFPRLEVLDLYENWIGGSFPDLTAFPSLRKLLLNKNQLNGTVPINLGQLSMLEHLDVSSNSLQGKISEAHLSNLSKLQHLDLSFNSLSLEFHSDWFPPFQLDFIKLAYCKLGPNFPNWLQNQNNFSVLDISSAEISATAPNWFWDVPPNLYYFNVSNNQIKGVLPNSSFKFTDIAYVDLSSNNFEGPIPLFPSPLTFLDLSKNKFLGPVSFLCASSGMILRYLDLSDNLLSGELPDCWMHLVSLNIVNLANNNLFGKIPSSIGSLTEIEMFQLRNNNLIGELPMSLKNCTKLSILDLGENRLSGTISTWIGDSLSNLVILSLRFNEFYGSIPLSICHLASVRILDLSQNNISGAIPKCLKNFTDMAQASSHGTVRYYSYGTTRYTSSLVNFYLNVDLWMIWKGRETEYIEKLGLLKSIDLSSNKLIGEIPSEVTSLLGLVALNLSRNSLIGLIPPKIGQLRSLNSLDLSRNQLSGGIPTSLSELSYLGVLDLSNNNLSGRIPLGTQLQGFNASAYSGNPALCGLPLTKVCPGDEAPQDPTIPDLGDDVPNPKHEDKFITTGFYISMGLGFALGFWGVCGTLLLKSAWRYAYFKSLTDIKDWFYVTTAVKMARLRRRLQR